jgi:hypothetical protein
MKSVSATLKVVGIHGETIRSLEPSDTLSSVFDIFCHHANQFQVATHEVPPQKKQRTSLSGTAVASGPGSPTPFDLNRVITLASISLDLVGINHC